jgi:hypothetical protein
MRLTVDVRPEVEAELVRQAAASGRAIEVHAAALLENAVHLQADSPPVLHTGQELINACAKVNGLLPDEESRAAQAANLIELFEPIRGLLTDNEVDTLFSRNPSFGRPVDLA